VLAPERRIAALAIRLHEGQFFIFALCEKFCAQLISARQQGVADLVVFKNDEAEIFEALKQCFFKFRTCYGIAVSIGLETKFGNLGVFSRHFSGLARVKRARV
jgi:hypothetical protein